MIRATLLLHFYNDQQFMGQKLHWVEVIDSRSLEVLIDLLLQGCKAEDMHGSDEFPTMSDRFQQIKRALIDVYTRLGHTFSREHFGEATTVRVMQVILDRPIEKPYYPGL